MAGRKRRKSRSDRSAPTNAELPPSSSSHEATERKEEEDSPTRLLLLLFGVPALLIALAVALKMTGVT